MAIPTKDGSVAGTLVNATVTASGTSSGYEVGTGRYKGATFNVKVSNVTGTTPTCDVYIQKLLPSGSYMDICAFAQLTAAAERTMEVENKGGSGSSHGLTPTDGTLTADTALECHMGDKLRCKYTIGGTNPSFDLEVYAEFWPQNGGN